MLSHQSDCPLRPVDIYDASMPYKVVRKSDIARTSVSSGQGRHFASCTVSTSYEGDLISHRLGSPSMSPGGSQSGSGDTPWRSETSLRCPEAPDLFHSNLSVFLVLFPTCHSFKLNTGSSSI